MPQTRNLLPVLFVVASLMGLPAAFAKRVVPADVPPVVSGGIRYEAPHFNNPCGQNGGCVVAYDDATGAQLWAVTVYCIHYQSNLEQDVQDVFITSLALADGKLQVTNERSQHFSIATATQEVTGDQRGCGGSSSGCAFVPVTKKSGAGLLVTVGLVGLAGALARARRQSGGRRRQR